jgi:bacillithiol system protein YtxJ
MGFLQKLFGGSTEPKDTKELPWILLTNMEQLHDIEMRSKTKPQVIFKYSTRCGINRVVMNRFVEDYGYSEEAFDLYYLDIIGYREISNAIAHRFNVVHESPQVLVIKNGTVVAQASHGAISGLDLKAFV